MPSNRGKTAGDLLTICDSERIRQVWAIRGWRIVPFRHPSPVIGYVIDGVLRTQVEGESEHIYHTGQTFYEAPNGIHQVSANASQTAPVKFLAYFVCDHEVPLSVVPPTSASTERR